MMSHTAPKPQPGGTPLVEAAAWQVYLEASGLGSSDEFVAWLSASKDNASAWQQVRGAWSLLDEHEQSDAGAELRSLALADAEASRATGKRRWWSSLDAGRRVAAAAAVVVAVGALTTWGILRPETYRTSSGERQVVTLSDDSRITLDADSEVQVRYSKERRDLVLSRGQARFDVAHDSSRPFSVIARDRQVVALGTSFNIDTLGPDLLVTLLKGRVVVAPQSAHLDLEAMRARTIESIATGVSASAPVVELAAGEQLVVRTDAAPSVVAISAAHVSAWESGHLLFDDEPLASVVERMSHYSSRRLLIADPRAADLRISGFFDAGDTAGFISTVTEYLPLNAVIDANGDIQLSHR